MNKNEIMVKMREMGIFKNKTSLNSEGTMMVHQDDMPSYNWWFLTSYHFVDKVIYRGLASNAPSDIQNLKESLDKIGNPKTILITYSEQDTY